MVYRMYEDPYKIEHLLYDARIELEEAKQNCKDEEYIMLLSETVEELEERLNFAWQDDEAEIEGYE